MSSNLGKITRIEPRLRPAHQQDEWPDVEPMTGWRLALVWTVLFTVSALAWYGVMRGLYAAVELDQPCASVPYHATERGGDCFVVDR